MMSLSLRSELGGISSLPSPSSTKDPFDATFSPNRTRKPDLLEASGSTLNATQKATPSPTWSPNLLRPPWSSRKASPRAPEDGPVGMVVGISSSRVSTQPTSQGRRGHRGSHGVDGGGAGEGEAVPGSERQLLPIVLPGACERYRYRAAENTTWDVLAENAAQLDFVRAGPSTPTQGPSGAALHPPLAVILVFCEACNPFHLGDVDALRRARRAVEAFPNAAVIGALVMPLSEDTLKGRGISSQRRLPFTLRRDVARSVIRTAEQAKWIAVDSCMEGSMKNVTGSLVPYLKEYAKCRLQRRNWDAHVLEVQREDPLDAAACSPKGSELRVHFEHHAHGFENKSNGEAVALPKRSLKPIQSVVVDVPKQEHFDELLWSAVAQAHDQSFQVALERLCGAGAAGLIREWACRNRGKVCRKSARIAPA
mmetsp:Transcript_17416/g.55127  ORF Transcript_17416/g.55127 Transcript_17416/m.55127 type:complete len:424 (+) Transcript_17416:3-1274(+)